jgi:hypothetical protein
MPDAAGYRIKFGVIERMKMHGPGMADEGRVKYPRHGHDVLAGEGGGGDEGVGMTVRGCRLGETPALPAGTIGLTATGLTATARLLEVSPRGMIGNRNHRDGAARMV